MELPEPTIPLPESILEWPLFLDDLMPLFLKTQTTTTTETMKTAPKTPITQIRMRLSTNALSRLLPVLDTSAVPAGMGTTWEEILRDVNLCTLCGVPSVVMFGFVFFQTFRLPIGLHSICSISPMAGGTCQKYLTRYHD